MNRKIIRTAPQDQTKGLCSSAICFQHGTDRCHKEVMKATTPPCWEEQSWTARKALCPCSYGRYKSLAVLICSCSSCLCRNCEKHLGSGYLPGQPVQSGGKLGAAAERENQGTGSEQTKERQKLDCHFTCMWILFSFAFCCLEEARKQGFQPMERGNDVLHL